MQTINLFKSYPSLYQPLAKSLRIVAMLALFWLASVMESRANVLSWSGNVDGNWNNIANWGFAATPTNGDTLIFSASQPNQLNTNNIPGLTLAQIRFVGPGGGYDIRGNAFTLTNSIEATNTAGANTIENAITFATVTPNVDVSVSLTLSGVLGGLVGFTKNGAGTLVFSGPASNTYLGTTTVNAGVLQLMKDGIIFAATAIPGNLVIGNGVSSATVQNIYSIEIADTATIIINNNGTYDLNGQTETVGTDLMFNGNSATVSLGGGSLTLSAPSSISVNGNNCAINGAGSLQLGAGPCGVNVIGTLKVFPSVQGAANITKTGPGNLYFYGANTYTGLTTISQGWLWAQNSLALGGTSSGTVVSNGATLVLQGGITVSNESLTLNGPGEPIWGALDCELFETNVWAGPITLAADNSTFANYGGGTLRIIGPISGPGGLNESYGGVLSLEGTSANTYAGTTVVTVGTLNLGKVGAPGAAYAVPNSLVLSNGTTARLYQPWQLYSPGRSFGLTTMLYPNSVFDLNGNNEWLALISLNGGQITSGPGFLYLSGDITVGTNAITNSGISGNLILYNYLTVTHTVITNVGHFFSPELTISANINSSGTNTLIKDGAGEVELSGTNNTFTGATTINAGALWIDYTNGLGNTNLPATVNGGSLFLENNASVGLKPLVLNGPGFGFPALTAFGNSSWGGNVTLAGNTTMAAFSIGENLTLSGAISGPGALTTSQSGTVTLTGPTDNSYGGITTVSSGTLLLDKFNSDSRAVPGNLDVFGTLRLGNYEQISDAADVMLEGGSLFDFGAFSETIDTLRGTGGITFGNFAYLLVGGNNGSSTYDGIMSGIGYGPGYTVGKIGSGTFTMNGNSTFTAGIFHVFSPGKLIVNGIQPQVPATVDSGAAFGGSGTVGNIIANGVISPGNSPGILTSSNVLFSSSGNLIVELTGPTPGVGGYDQLNIRGTNKLTNPTLTVIPAFTTPVAVGQTFNIINNDLADANIGTFNGLAEGAGITANGFGFRLSYVGGTGNDVVLTLTNVPLAQAGSSVTLGNGSGTIDPNECNYLSVGISNKLGTPITGISATLASATPNVTITQPFAAYPDVPGNGTGTNITPFQISTGTNFACGTTINLTLTVATASEGSFSVPVVLTSGSPAAVSSRYDNSTATAIPDVGTLESTNNVSGFVGPLTKVVVALYLTHTFDSDLTNISLIAPDGTTVLLSAANGGSGQNYGNNCSPDASRTTFDDAAGTSITGGAAPFVGTFRPQSPLSAFNGNGTPNGNWRLHIADGFGGSLGTLRCWSLFLYGTACTPGGGLCELCPNTILMGATGSGSVMQTNYVNPNGVPSTCGVSKTCPGTLTGSVFPSDNYIFRNGPSDACITVTLEDDAPGVQMLSAAYLGSYDPANSDKCVNYLADCGIILNSGHPVQSYSFNVASNATFVVNVIGNILLTAPYKLTVTGGDCRPMLNVTPVAAQTVQLDWTTAAAGFGLESTNNLGGGGTNWTAVTNIPMVINSRFTVTNNAASSNQFYRLHKPY